MDYNNHLVEVHSKKFLSETIQHCEGYHQWELVSVHDDLIPEQHQFGEWQFVCEASKEPWDCEQFSVEAVVFQMLVKDGICVGDEMVEDSEIL